MIVEYKGKQVDTIFDKQMTQEQYEDLLKQFNEIPTLQEIKNEIYNLIFQNGCKMDKIEKKYFKKLMFDCKLYTSKWTINEVFEYKPLLDVFYSKTLANPNVFNNELLIDRIMAAIRLGGKGIAQKVSNYPIGNIDQVLARYNVNNNWYDMSCGWGARLIGALKNNVNYFGTDPNYKLVEQLNNLNNDWQMLTMTKTNCEIRCQGSEVFIPQWENKMGLCFTSPPYFNLEDYKYGDQSCKEDTTYEMWKENYLQPTIQNCYKYLIDEGYLAINIKNFNNLDLEGDTIKIAENNGFKYIEDFKLKNIQRIKETKELLDNSERIMIFMKKGFEQTHKKYRVPQATNIFDFL